MKECAHCHKNPIPKDYGNFHRSAKDNGRRFVLVMRALSPRNLRALRAGCLLFARENGRKLRKECVDHLPETRGIPGSFMLFFFTRPKVIASRKVFLPHARVCARGPTVPAPDRTRPSRSARKAPRVLCRGS